MVRTRRASVSRRVPGVLRVVAGGVVARPVRGPVARSRGSPCQRREPIGVLHECVSILVGYVASERFGVRPRRTTGPATVRHARPCARPDAGAIRTASAPHITYGGRGSDFGVATLDR